MPNKDRCISFVTYRDGNIDLDSLRLGPAELAKRSFIRKWVPEVIFPDDLSWSTVDALWRSAAKAGAKCHTIEIGKDMQPQIVE